MKGRNWSTKALPDDEHPPIITLAGGSVWNV
jgi:hypothetical protein